MTAASKVADDVNVLLCGSVRQQHCRPPISASLLTHRFPLLSFLQGADAASKEAAGFGGVSKVFTAESDALSNGLAESIAPVIADLQGSAGFSHIVAAHSASG